MPSLPPTLQPGTQLRARWLNSLRNAVATITGDLRGVVSSTEGGVQSVGLAYHEVRRRSRYRRTFEEYIGFVQSSSPRIPFTHQWTYVVKLALVDANGDPYVNLSGREFTDVLNYYEQNNNATHYNIGNPLAVPTGGLSTPTAVVDAVPDDSLVLLRAAQRPDEEAPQFWFYTPNPVTNVTCET